MSERIIESVMDVELLLIQKRRFFTATASEH